MYTFFFRAFLSLDIYDTIIFFQFSKYRTSFTKGLYTMKLAPEDGWTGSVLLEYRG